MLGALWSFSFYFLVIPSAFVCLYVYFYAWLLRSYTKLLRLLVCVTNPKTIFHLHSIL